MKNHSVEYQKKVNQLNVSLVEYLQRAIELDQSETALYASQILQRLESVGLGYHDIPEE